LLFALGVLLFLASLRLGFQLYRSILVFQPAHQLAYRIARGNSGRMQERPVQAIAENKNAIVGVPG
jgi:hypothetical protein